LKETNLTVAQLVILALLLVGPLAAQDVDVNKVDIDALPLNATPEAASTTHAKPERVFDKKFFVIMGSLAGAESLRFTSRKLVIEREYAAGAPWITSVPSNQHIVAKNLALYASEFFVAYELKKSHSWLPGDGVIRKLWWVYPAVMTAIHLKNAVGNIRTRSPGGCTSVECAMQLQTQ
jgi:hypothetical protein